MRPYFAIIQDSFREALASRTLQVLLVLITVLLVCLAIPGLRMELPAELTVEQVHDPDGLAGLLGRTRAGGMSAAQLHMRERLSPELQTQFTDYRKSATVELRDKAIEKLVAEMNALLPGESLYNADAWREVDLSAEGRKLLARPWGELSLAERSRLNRLLFDSAFGGHVREADAVRTYLTYIVSEIELPLPPEVAHTLVQSLVYVLLKWFVGAAGMLAAVIFTASMIPQMFEPGAIDLLLSKPVSRSAAFLAKFCGGCIFILLNASLFVVGLWLILGLRHGQWNSRLLLAIPVFVLAFAIYFSISAYVGVRWRNPILAIALALVAWMGTFVLHQGWYWGQKTVLDGQRAEVVLPTDAGPIVARKSGEVLRWTGDEWQSIFAEASIDPTLAVQRGTGVLYPLLGPVLVGTGEAARLVAVERRFAPPLFMNVGNVVTGTAADGWKRVTGPVAPTDAFALRSTVAGDVLLITRSGIRKFVFPAETGAIATGDAAGITLLAIGPPQALWPEPVDAAIDPLGGQIAVFTRGRVLLLTRSTTGDYVLSAARETADASAALIAITRSEVLLARADGRVERLDRDSLKPLPGDVQLPAVPKRLFTAADREGLLVLDHERRLRRLEADGGVSTVSVRGQGELTSVAVAPDGRVLTADRFPRVTTYAPNGTVQATAEKHTGVALAFLWGINPLRTVLPKPDELDLLVREAVGAGGDEQTPGGDDLTREREYVDLWTPVWTSGLFVAAMLALCCWTIERRDF